MCTFNLNILCTAISFEKKAHYSILIVSACTFMYKLIKICCIHTLAVRVVKYHSGIELEVEPLHSADTPLIA